MLGVFSVAPRAAGGARTRDVLVYGRQFCATTGVGEILRAYMAENPHLPFTLAFVEGTGVPYAALSTARAAVFWPWTPDFLSLLEAYAYLTPVFLPDERLFAHLFAVTTTPRNPATML